MVFIETSVFKRQASGGLFDDESLRQLQCDLALDPEAGKVIRGSGGLRKIRLAGLHTGKSGAFRVIYYWQPPDTIFLLLAYAKNRQATLTAAQLRQLAQLIQSS